MTALRSLRVAERLVSWVWEQQVLLGPLSADDGHQYQVVYRGRAWGDRRTDFQGAVLAREDGLLLKGDVEIHVFASDWARHGHHVDPGYDRVVAHVVLWNDAGRPTVRSDGQHPPTLELIKHLAQPIAELERRRAQEERAPLTTEPCAHGGGDPAAMVERAGQDRFLEKSARFEADLTCVAPDEVLYRGLLRAMGYSANIEGFETLAGLVPLSDLASAAALPRRQRLVELQAILLGAAGLLPAQRGLEAPDPWAAEVERAWSGRGSGGPGPDGLPRWQTWRVRPEGLPARRLAGVSYLAADWLARDTVDRLVDEALSVAVERKPAVLAARWRATAEDPFWPWFYDFDCPAPARRPSLIGADRAGEVVVNVVLPLLHALGQAAGDEVLSRRAWALYQRYPGTAPNRLVREMALQLGGERSAEFARGALRQQGLIHLYKHWCDWRDCRACPASGSQPAAALTVVGAGPAR
ncbi:MAG: DUF2851 family protein [Chloroflexota bacterium]